MLTKALAWYDSGGEGAREGFRADGATHCDHDDTLFCKEHRVNRACPDCSAAEEEEEEEAAPEPVNKEARHEKEISN